MSVRMVHAGTLTSRTQPLTWVGLGSVACRSGCAAVLWEAGASKLRHRRVGFQGWSVSCCMGRGFGSQPPTSVDDIPCMQVRHAARNLVRAEADGRHVGRAGLPGNAVLALHPECAPVNRILHADARCKAFQQGIAMYAEL